MPRLRNGWLYLVGKTDWDCFWGFIYISAGFSLEVCYDISVSVLLGISYRQISYSSKSYRSFFPTTFIILYNCCRRIILFFLSFSLLFCLPFSFQDEDCYFFGFNRIPIAYSYSGAPSG